MCHGQEGDSPIETFRGARADRYMLRDGMVYYQDSICSTPGLTLRGMIAREFHDALSVR